MEQATQPTTSTAPPETRTPDDQHAAFQRALRVSGTVVAGLTVRPFAVEIGEDWPVGWSAHLKFRAERGAGLFEFARLVGARVTRADTSFGVHLDAYTRIDGMEVRGSALVSPIVAAQLVSQPDPIPTSEVDAEDEVVDDTVTVLPSPTPLGSSVLAHVAAVSPSAPEADAL